MIWKFTQVHTESECRFYFNTAVFFQVKNKDILVLHFFPDICHLHAVVR